MTWVWLIFLLVVFLTVIAPLMRQRSLIASRAAGCRSCSASAVPR